MICLYPGEEKYTNLNGFCGVHVDGGANELDISILGIKNSIDVWSGTEMTCTRNETVGGIGFDRFLTIGQGNTVALSGITIIGGGIEVQGGTFTGSLFDIHHCGTSKNVVNALISAKKQGCKLIGFSGREGGSFNSICDVNIIIPSNDTPRIQEMHIVVGHTICHLIELAFTEN